MTRPLPAGPLTGALLLLLLTLALPAAAQGQVGTSAPGTALGSEALGSMTVPTDGLPPLPPGPLTALGDRLRERGVSLGLTLVNAHFRNPSTGISPGHSGNFGELFFSATLNLEKIAGLANTQLDITEALNKPSYNNDGYLFQAGSAFAPFPVINKTTDLVNFTLSHRLLDRRLKIEFGRMNLSREFMVANMCGGCLISAQATVLNQPGVSKSSWGATARYDLDPHSTVGAALLEDNPAMWQRTTGWQWRHDTAVGYTGMLNYTRRRGFDDVALPYKLEAGLFHATARYTDPLYNTDGSSQVEQPGGTPLQHAGRSGGYLQGRQVTWRRAGAPAGTPENVAAYGGLTLAPGAGESFPIEAYGGTEWSGLLPRNPLAMVGTMVRYIRMSERRALYEQQTRRAVTTGMNMASGGAVPIVNDALPRDMFLFDVHGRIGLMPGVFLQSSIQYLKNPNATLPITPTRIPNGYLFNLMLVADFGVLSGLSRLPGDKIF
jgi:porin